jgi:pimeloyl-ACP methyl ester carboxylesterase
VVAIERLRNAKKISTPVLYLHGEQDGCIGYEARKGQERFFTNGLREVLIERVGHFVPLEAPERMAREVIAWCAL